MRVQLKLPNVNFSHWRNICRVVALTALPKQRHLLDFSHLGTVSVPKGGGEGVMAFTVAPGTAAAAAIAADASSARVRATVLSEMEHSNKRDRNMRISYGQLNALMRVRTLQHAQHTRFPRSHNSLYLCLFINRVPRAMFAGLLLLY